MEEAQTRGTAVHVHCGKALDPLPLESLPCYPNPDAYVLQCAVLAAAVIGSFSWTGLPDAYWLASALWQCSLVLSILGILLAAQQLTVLDLLGVPQPVADGRPSALSAARKKVRRFLPLMLTEVGPGQVERGERGRTESGLPDGGEVARWKPRWKMVFAWQCPVMFMSYSVLLYLGGLTVYVCSPLIKGSWDASANVSCYSFCPPVSLPWGQWLVLIFSKDRVRVSGSHSSSRRHLCFLLLLDLSLCRP